MYPPCGGRGRGRGRGRRGGRCVSEFFWFEDITVRGGPARADKMRFPPHQYTMSQFERRFLCSRTTRRSGLV